MTDANNTPSPSIQGLLYQVQAELEHVAAVWDFAELCEVPAYCADVPSYLRTVAEKLRAIRHAYNGRHGL